MANTEDLIDQLEGVLNLIIEEGLYAESLPKGSCKDALDTFIEDYTPSSNDEARIKSFGNILTSLIDHDISLSRVMEEYEEKLNTFLEHYEHPSTSNIIQVDCKVDMAIPKEDLQTNLQLLIDRHGVQHVSSIIEKALEYIPLVNKLK